jgi:hypothetical protein
VGKLPGLALAFGAATILAVLLFYALIWFLLTLKKQVALAVGLVVLKFAIFGGIVWAVLKFFETNFQYDATQWFALGISTLILTLISGAVRAFYLV